MSCKHDLYVGDYRYNRHNKTLKFIAGYKSRRYFDGDDWSWAYWPNLWEITCKNCICRVLKKNKNKLKATFSVVSLSCGKDYTPETWPLIP